MKPHIHFGDFLRHHLDKAGGQKIVALSAGCSVASLRQWSLSATREESTLTPRLAEPLARALGFTDADAMDRAWQSTKVLPYARKQNPMKTVPRAVDTLLAATDDELRPFAARIAERISRLQSTSPTNPARDDMTLADIAGGEVAFRDITDDTPAKNAKRTRRRKSRST